MIFIIFGGTGDLAHRKLYPALQNLMFDGEIDKDVKVYGIGSREKSQSKYRNSILEALKQFSRREVDIEKCKDKLDDFKYLQGDINNKDIYKEIKKEIGEEKDVVYYLAVKPEFFSVISHGLGQEGLNFDGSKLVIEKPFGLDIESAREINNNIMKYFDENKVYRIDHYLGKEMTQNIFILRFANEIFEPFLNSEYVDNIQISVCESIGISKRGRYYDKSGALRDMMQNHIMQLLSLATMEKPNSLKADDIIDKKVEIINQLELASKDIEDCVVFGQYEGYRNEQDVEPDSTTETYVGISASINNDRWRGTKVFLKTGKMMKEKYVQIVYELKKPIESLYGRKVKSNKLIIRIQPEEGAMIHFNLKRPGNDYVIKPVEMEFCQNCGVGINSQEAYEKIIKDIFSSDKTSFARWDEVEKSWLFVDELVNIDEKRKRKMLKTYEKNSTGPGDAEKILGFTCEK